jgi:hypothetical protein
MRRQRFGTDRSISLLSSVYGSSSWWRTRFGSSSFCVRGRTAHPNPAGVGLLTVEEHGRHRYYRLATPHVEGVLEALARLAPQRPINSLRGHSRAHALRAARTCYGHLAGQLGGQHLSWHDRPRMGDRRRRAASPRRGHRSPLRIRQGASLSPQRLRRCRARRLGPVHAEAKTPRVQSCVAGSARHERCWPCVCLLTDGLG